MSDSWQLFLTLDWIIVFRRMVDAGATPCASTATTGRHPQYFTRAVKLTWDDGYAFEFQQ